MYKAIFLFFAFSLFINNCNSNEQTDAKDTNINQQIKQWKEYLSTKDISIENENLYVLIFHPSPCPHCLKILKEWDAYYLQSETMIYLVLIEKYRTNATNFVKNNDISIPHLQDVNGRLFEKNLIDMVPSIVYINDNQKNITSNYLGDKTEYNGIKDFLKKSNPNN